MSLFWTIGLGVPLGISVLVAASLAAWRLIPRNPTNISVNERLADLEAQLVMLRTMVVDFGDKYETALGRAKGRKRRKDFEEEQVPATPPPAPVIQLHGKDELRERAKALGLKA